MVWLWVEEHKEFKTKDLGKTKASILECYISLKLEIRMNPSQEWDIKVVITENKS